MTTAARLCIRLSPDWEARRRRADLHRALRDEVYLEKRRLRSEPYWMRTDA